MFKKILAANDGSEHANAALDAAAELAKALGSNLHVVLVEEVNAVSGTIGDIREAKTHEDRLLHRHEKTVRGIAMRHGCSPQLHVFTGHPVEQITDLVSSGRFELLVVGATGHHAGLEVLFGSPADRLVRHAACPVLIVR